MKIFSSLRFRVIAMVVFTMLALLLVLFSLVYVRTLDFIHAQAQHTAQSVGQLVIASVRHTMDIHDIAMLERVMRDSSSLANIERVDLIGIEAQSMPLDAPECAVCHARATVPVESNALFQSAPGRESYRFVSAIASQAECRQCHTANAAHVGIMLVDVSITNQIEDARRVLSLDAFFSVMAIGLVAALLVALTDRLFVGRLKSFERPLANYRAHNFATRLPVSAPGDEIDDLARAFNDAFERIEKGLEAELRHKEAIQQNIIAERERIARELHDNLPQVLAYFNTKIGAIRLLMQQEKTDDALDNLAQLDDTSRMVLTDVRETIMGLRASRFLDDGFLIALHRYMGLFREVCSAEVTLWVEPQESLNNIPPDVEIQALRIIQEALSNVRKHAGARRVTIRVGAKDGRFEGAVEDDGAGFDPGALDARKASYGLMTMRERAEAHGGTFVIESQPARGTRVRFSLPLDV